MKRNLNFKFDCSKEVASQKVKEYFLSQGFKLHSNYKDQLVFKRGSILLNMVTFNPFQWNSTITIEIADSVINSEFDINTDFQAVTLKEEQLWENFIDNFKKSIIDNLNYSSINKKLLRETKYNSLKYVKPALIGGLAAAIPGGIIAYFTGAGSVVAIAAAGGAMSYVMHQIEQEKKKNNAI
ncbi:hypothetical protein [Pontibacter ramchanderi]|uniref:Uncharacterized protein n=1 Tax=Pontibacter ramchanderi TaxID=1179743 RepID=A0A2N3V3A3_9BACT|nr:hypothetical protein [Pontibacter ramchanderi]PKV76111.1 hypothetical protein BD749_1061 [Pontibacter ramchanderi]